jgi:hypothetical protein
MALQPKLKIRHRRTPEEFKRDMMTAIPTSKGDGGTRDENAMKRGEA